MRIDIVVSVFSTASVGLQSFQTVKIRGMQNAALNVIMNHELPLGRINVVRKHKRTTDENLTFVFKESLRVFAR